MYYILYNLKTLRVEHIYNKPLTANVCDNFYEIKGVAEYGGEIPQNNWLTVDNIHEEIETWTEKDVNEQGKEVEVQCSKTHIVCDLVPHFYPKREPTQKQLAAKRIAELKKLLADTDYQAIKYAEGWLTEQEYAPIKAQRQAWRDEINQLESKLI